MHPVCFFCLFQNRIYRQKIDRHHKGETTEVTSDQLLAKKKKLLFIRCRTKVLTAEGVPPPPPTPTLECQMMFFKWRLGSKGQKIKEKRSRTLRKHVSRTRM